MRAGGQCFMSSATRRSVLLGKTATMQPTSQNRDPSGSSPLDALSHCPTPTSGGLSLGSNLQAVYDRLQDCGNDILLASERLKETLLPPDFDPIPLGRVVATLTSAHSQLDIILEYSRFANRESSRLRGDVEEVQSKIDTQRAEVQAIAPNESRESAEARILGISVALKDAATVLIDHLPPLKYAINTLKNAPPRASA